MQEYVAVTLFELSTDDEVLLEENFVLLKASNREDAKKRIEKYSKKLEGVYDSVAGKKVTNRFVKLIDINEVLYEDFENNIREIYSRHFEKS